MLDKDLGITNHQRHIQMLVMRSIEVMNNLFSPIFDNMFSLVKQFEPKKLPENSNRKKDNC